MRLLHAGHRDEPVRPLSACNGATTREAINNVLAGNLCRCTGYRPIVDAALEACAEAADDRFTRSGAARLQALRSLDDKADLFVGDDGCFFAAPASEQCLAQLYARHPDATIVAGATDVGLWITKKLAPIEKVIHVGRVAGLSSIEATSEGYAIGATVSLARAAPVLGSIDPDIAEVLRRFGSIQVRACGTVGGNIANGSPIGDLAPMLIAMGASRGVASRRAGSHLPLENFFLDYGKQDRQPGEFVRRLLVPKLSPGTHFRAYKISKRFDEDISAVLARILPEGRRRPDQRSEGCLRRHGRDSRSARRPSKRHCAACRLTANARWQAAADAVGEDFTPLTDLRASAAYRLRVAGNLVIKALAEIAGVEQATRRASPDRRMIADAAE